MEIKTKKEYHTVQAITSAKLDIEVNRHLDAGFALFGNPYVVPQGNFYCQAVTRIAPPLAKKVGAALR
jgi:hypothetical protein